MESKTLWILLAMGVVSMFGQVPALAKAGERAPNLTWTKIVASVPASGGPRSLFGQTTVLLFLPPVSHNEQAVSMWNKLVEQFADKPVNFVWIANEAEESLARFLKSHPVRGWLALDPQEESYKVYGVEGAAGVLIDQHGMIAGFTFMTPEENEIQAVLDGRAIAIKGTPSEAQMDAILDGKAVRLEAEPFRSPPPAQKPDVPPSEEVHISRSQTEGTAGSIAADHWIQRGFGLRAILSKVLGTNPSRIELPAALDSRTRYDFVLVPPRDEDEETMNRQVREGIEKYFHVTITLAMKSMDVYVMTTVEGKAPPKKSERDALGGGIGVSTRTFKLPEGTPPTREALEEALRRSMATAELTAMTALSSSMDDFRRALEDGLHRPIVDETKLTGIYDFKIEGEAQTTEEFLGMLRDQVGILLTPTRRSIEMTVVQPVE
jgi:uncharacterized protein (TIGR03435 family)